MTDVHIYEHDYKCSANAGFSCDCANGCAARVRCADILGTRPNTTTTWCGAPYHSPYHYGYAPKHRASPPDISKAHAQRILARPKPAPIRLAPLQDPAKP